MRLLNEVLGQSVGGDVYMVDHIFKDNDRVGAVGSIYRPVMLEEWRDATSDEGLQRNLARWWKDARRRGDQRGIGEFAAVLFAEKGEGTIWDMGEPEKADRARRFTGLSVADAPIFTCCGGGLCIDRGISWAKVANPERLFRLLDLANGSLEAWEYFVNCE